MKYDCWQVALVSILRFCSASESWIGGSLRVDKVDRIGVKLSVIVRKIRKKRLGTSFTWGQNQTDPFFTPQIYQREVKRVGVMFLKC